MLKETTLTKSFLHKVAGYLASHCPIKTTPGHVFPQKLWKNIQNNCSVEHFWVTASDFI